jgi:hypothetical protein
MTEPVIAEGWDDGVAVADVLVLPAAGSHWMSVCDAAFTRWPGLALVVFREGHGVLVMATRDGMRCMMLNCPSGTKKTVDIIRMIYTGWSLAAELLQPGTHGVGAAGEG